MPYCNASPSSKNNIGSGRHWVAFQRDGLYTVVGGEGRAHLKHNIRSPRISSSSIFEEMFCKFVIFFCVLYTKCLIFYCSHYKKTLLCMLFTFIEQKIDIINLNHSPDLLFLMRGNFYSWTWICSYVLLWTGACIDSSKILLNS
jgi:hypothetical protein